MNKSVFENHGRWLQVKIAIFTAFAIFCFAGLLAAIGLSQSPFNPSFPKSQKQEIIKQIATRIEDKIELIGEGPILELKEQNGQYYLNRTLPQNDGQNTVHLTFDDGPSPLYTGQILDILDQENIKATFFVLGENVYKYPKLAEEITARGHLIGLHTFSHTPEEKSLEGKDLQLYLEFELTQRLIQTSTGKTSKIFRMPYAGTEETISLNNLILTVNATQRGYVTIGSTVDSLDWQGEGSEQIIKNIQDGNQVNPVILLHDSGGDRSYTVAALPRIIAHYKNLNYQFKTVENLMGAGQPILTRVTLKDKLHGHGAVLFYSLIKKAPNLASTIFVIGLAAFGITSIFTTIFAIAHYFKHVSKKQKQNKFSQKVSVVIPTYNEEKVIQKTIKSILASDYKNLDVIVVDDGSTDSTSQKLFKFLDDKKVKICWQPNRGKFSALNFGFESSSGKIIVTVDADTQILPDTVSQLVKHFSDKKIGAVAGNVKVGNRKNLLTTLQELDYRMAINLERRAFDFLNSAFIVPGAIGAWRKKAVFKTGRFSHITLTEDAEMGLRLRKAGYKIIYEPDAVGFTEVPQDLDAFIRQRFRWTFGIIQTLWLHKDMVFKTRYGFLGSFILPYMIFIQIPSMVIAPIIEISAIPLIVLGHFNLIISSFALLLFSRLMLFILASLLSKENFLLAPYIIPFRFFYQFLWYFVYNLAIFTAIKGSLVTWQKLTHFGFVDISHNGAD